MSEDMKVTGRFVWHCNIAGEYEEHGLLPADRDKRRSEATVSEHVRS